jgi:hypothetical protein
MAPVPVLPPGERVAQNCDALLVRAVRYDLRRARCQLPEPAGVDADPVR